MRDVGIQGGGINGDKQDVRGKGDGEGAEKGDGEGAEDGEEVIRIFIV
jgi:hypothetical protein